MGISSVKHSFKSAINVHHIKPSSDPPHLQVLQSKRVLRCLFLSTIGLMLGTTGSFLASTLGRVAQALAGP